MMKGIAVIAVAMMVALLACSCASDGDLDDAQRLEKYDIYVPWWTQEQ